MSVVTLAGQWTRAAPSAVTLCDKWICSIPGRDTPRSSRATQPWNYTLSWALSDSLCSFN